MADPAQEIGPQRRRAADGAPLHACCMCDTLAPWGATWSWYGSVEEEDEGKPVAKFCSAPCKARAGPRAGKVTRR